MTQILDVLDADMTRLGALLDSHADEVPAFDAWMAGGGSSYQRHHGILRPVGKPARAAGAGAAAPAEAGADSGEVTFF